MRLVLSILEIKQIDNVKKSFKEKCFDVRKKLISQIVDVMYKK